MFARVDHSVEFSRGMFGCAANPQRIEEVLRSLSLWDKREAKIRELSGGMKRRVMIAKALSHDPELLFLDEPTAGLDPIGAAAFDKLTRELTDILGLTVFLITHDLDTLHEICDRVAVIADKKIIAVGTIPELLASDHPWIQEYFNGPRGRAALASQELSKAMDSKGKAGE
jgi:phospholipid/cholesterol/gamma-HCH transport system ATP-binding protein